MWPFTKRNRHRPLDPIERIRGNLQPRVADLEIPVGSYAVAFVDMDMGSIMGDRPDRETEVAATFEDALRLAATNDDEEEVAIFNAGKEMVLYRFGWERFSYPDDPVRDMLK